MIIKVYNGSLRLIDWFCTFPGKLPYGYNSQANAKSGSMYSILYYPDNSAHLVPAPVSSVLWCNDNKPVNKDLVHSLITLQDDVVKGVVGSGKPEEIMGDDEENSFIDISFFATVFSGLKTRLIRNWCRCKVKAQKTFFLEDNSNMKQRTKFRNGFLKRRGHW